MMEIIKEDGTKMIIEKGEKVSIKTDQSCGCKIVYYGCFPICVEGGGDMLTATFNFDGYKYERD